MVAISFLITRTDDYSTTLQCACFEKGQSYFEWIAQVSIGYPKGKEMNRLKENGFDLVQSYHSTVGLIPKLKGPKSNNYLPNILMVSYGPRINRGVHVNRIKS